jgi:hypothetical protein
MAFTVDLACPGTTDNRAIIKTDLDLNTGGLNTLWNSGTCTLYVGAVDSSGSSVGDMTVEPGDHIDHYQPPAGAVSIYAVCDKDCEGTATLNYDDPDLVA